MVLEFFHNSGIESITLDLQNMELNINWEDMTCPICLDFPHNAVLLQCSSYDKGCRPFMCDTDHSQSNCLDRFRSAYGLLADVDVSSTVSGTSALNIRVTPSDSGSSPTCPLCRGEVTGWFVMDDARAYLNMKKKCCQEKQCSYIGNYVELQQHARQEHPHARPSEIDPAQQLDWEIFQQSSEIMDVLSTVQSEVPYGLVLGDYVIGYGDDGDDGGDVYEFEGFAGDDISWETSLINFSASRNRRRSRSSETRRNQFISNEDVSNIDGVASGESANNHSQRRRRSQPQDP